MLSNTVIDEIIRMALKEDIGSGDITTLSTVDKDKQIKGNFLAKEEGVICGLIVAKRVFELIDADIELKYMCKEGRRVKKGGVIAEISGPARGILTGERTALNFLQHMSGIATRTSKAVKEAAGTKAVIADTRKTAPGLRLLEKYAVKIGGGVNHRFNLTDGILIKDNHIRSAGGITAAVEKARKSAPHTLKIEVEVSNFAELEEALICKADIIMLDNMTVEDMKKAVEIADGRALMEASGNMGDKNLREVAMTGIDIISIGALTHSVRAMDISLKFIF